MSDRIHAAGAEVIAVSVDSDERNAGMFARWPTPYVSYVSDPDGDRFLKRIDMFDPDERDGIALPGMFLIDADGVEVFGTRGVTFADRGHDDELLAALEELDESAIDPPAGGPADADVDVHQPGAFMPASFGAYFRGNMFGALAIQMRADGDEARSLAREHRLMAKGMLDAWAEMMPH